jgi:hypothetical protein
MKPANNKTNKLLNPKNGWSIYFMGFAALCAISAIVWAINMYS